MTAESASKSSTRAVERALGLLADVCDHGPLSLTECARRSDLSSSTALRLLRTLETAGFLARDGAGDFRAGARLVQIGSAALGRQSLVGLCDPAMRRIVAACGESTYLSILGPQQTAIYVGMVEGSHPVRHTSWVGRTVTLAGSAVGSALRGEVARGGYVATRSAIESDVTAIAAPIRSAGGIVGAISVVGPTYRMSEDQIELIGVVLHREVIELGQQLAASTAQHIEKYEVSAS